MSNQTGLSNLIVSLIDAFLKGKVNEFNLTVDTVFSEEEFKSFTQNYTFDEKKTYTYRGTVIDEYQYILDGTFAKRLTISYVKRDNGVLVYGVKGEIELWW